MNTSLAKGKETHIHITLKTIKTENKKQVQKQQTQHSLNADHNFYIYSRMMETSSTLCAPVRQKYYNISHLQGNLMFPSRRISFQFSAKNIILIFAMFLK